MEFPNKYEAERHIRDTDRSLVLTPIWEGALIKWAALPAADAAPILEKVRAAIGPMQIELRKIQHAAFASEETNCFSADIYINGKKAGYAHNEGHGGPTSVEPHDLSQRLDAYGATLPLTITDIKDAADPTGFFTMQPDAESIVDDLLEKHLAAKEAEKEAKKLQRDLTCRLLYTKKGEKGIYQTKKLEPAQFQKLKADPALRAKWSIDVMLNDLPFAEAQKVFNANIKRVYR